MITSPGLINPSPLSNVCVTVLVILISGLVCKNVLVGSFSSAVFGSSELSETTPAVELAVAITLLAINPLASISGVMVTDAE